LLGDTLRFLASAALPVGLAPTSSSDTMMASAFWLPAGFEPEAAFCCVATLVFAAALPLAGPAAAGSASSSSASLASTRFIRRLV
jgi:hypothetical protein